jgi:hypothetical protein
MDWKALKLYKEGFEIGLGYHPGNLAAEGTSLE